MLGTQLCRAKPTIHENFWKLQISKKSNFGIALGSGVNLRKYVVISNPDSHWTNVEGE